MLFCCEMLYENVWIVGKCEHDMKVILCFYVDADVNSDRSVKSEVLREVTEHQKVKP